MAIAIVAGARNAAVDGVVDLADAGAAAAHLKIYSGSQNADPSVDPVGTLLVNYTLSDPAFGAAASGSAALSGTPKSTTASAAGTAGCFVLEDSNGANVLQGSVTATGGGGDLTLDNTSIASGQTVNITSLNVSIPAS